MGQITIRSTKAQLEEFKESFIWQDICAELEMWKEGFRQEMEAIVTDAADNNPSTASVLLHMGNIDGRIKAVDYMLGIPEVFIEILKTKQEEEDQDE